MDTQSIVVHEEHPSWSHIPEPRRSLLLSKHRIFQLLTQDFPVTLGQDVSKSERKAQEVNEGYLTYGELGITHIDFMSIGEAVDLIQTKYGGLTGREEVFYDLGKAVVAAALLGPFSQCKGIEILPGLHTVSLRLKALYDTQFPQIATQHPELFPTVPRIEFSQGSFVDNNWSDASFFFANSTCFGSDLMDAIANRPFPINSFAITLTRNLPGKNWIVLESFRRPMSWGQATVIIQKRIT